MLNFLEWVQLKEEVLEEAGRHAYQRDLDAGAPDEETFRQDQQAGINYYVINNAMAFLNSTMKPAEKDPETGEVSYALRDKPVNPQSFSLFKIQNIEGSQVMAVRHVGKTWSQGKSKGMHVDSLADVSDSFKDVGFGQSHDRYFINLNGSGGANASKIKALHQKYLGLTKAQVGGDKLAGSIFFGDEDSTGGIDNPVAKKVMRQGAQDMKDQQWLDFANRASHGQDITQMARQAAIDDESGYNSLENPRFLEKLRLMGAESVVDQLKAHGHMEASGEEQQAIQTAKQLDYLAKSGQMQHLAGSPEFEDQVRNPLVLRFARVLGLQALVDYIDQGGGDLVARMKQPDAIRNARVGKTTGEPLEPTGTDAPNLGQMLGIEHLQEGFKRLWKFHNDTKTYNYFPE